MVFKDSYSHSTPLSAPICIKVVVHLYKSIVGIQVGLNLCPNIISWQVAAAAAPAFGTADAGA